VKSELATGADVSSQIRIIRGQRVLLDADLAALYGVTTKRLNEQVRRNADRFPEDFAISLNNHDITILRSQIAALRLPHGRHRKYPPIAFTEHGAIMAANVLNSARAVQMSVYVVRAFVKTRELLPTHAVLAREMAVLKKSVAKLDEITRRQFDQVYEAILGLMNPATKRQ
jgi:hypothetical protein